MDLINKIVTEILNPLIGLMFAVAFAFFIWGVIEFIWNAGNEEKRTTGKQHIVWGLAGLLIMSAVWGIIAIIKNFVKF
jgi:hypothetical protein